MLIYKSIHSILHSKESNPTMIMYSLTPLDFDKLLLLKKNLNFINTRMYLLHGYILALKIHMLLSFGLLSTELKSNISSLALP